MAHDRLPKPLSSLERFNDDAMTTVVRSFGEVGIDASFGFSVPKSLADQPAYHDHDDSTSSLASLKKKHSCCSFCLIQFAMPGKLSFGFSAPAGGSQKVQGERTPCAEAEALIQDKKTKRNTAASPGKIDAPQVTSVTSTIATHLECWDSLTQVESGDPMYKHDSNDESSGNPIDEKTEALYSSLRAFMDCGVNLAWGEEPGVLPSAEHLVRCYDENCASTPQHETGKKNSDISQKQRKIMGKISADALKAARGCSAVVRGASCKQSKDPQSKLLPNEIDREVVVSRLMEIRDSLKDYVSELVQTEDGTRDPDFDEALEKFQERLESDILAATGKSSNEKPDCPLEFEQFETWHSDLNLSHPILPSKQPLWNSEMSWSFEDAEPLPPSGNESVQSGDTRNPSRKNHWSSNAMDRKTKLYQRQSNKNSPKHAQYPKYDAGSSDFSVNTVDVDNTIFRQENSSDAANDSRHLGARLERPFSRQPVEGDEIFDEFDRNLTAAVESELRNFDLFPYSDEAKLSATTPYRRLSTSSPISSTGYDSDTEDAERTRYGGGCDEEYYY